MMKQLLSKRFVHHNSVNSRVYESLRLDEIKVFQHWCKKYRNNDKYIPYTGHLFDKTCNIASFIQAYDYLKPKESNDSRVESLMGRVHSRREAGKKLVFLDLVENHMKLQVKCQHKMYNDIEYLEKILHIIRPGDVIGVRGVPNCSNRGELSIVPSYICLLTPCLQNIPEQLTDAQTRYSQRYLDMRVNTTSSLHMIRVRARVLKHIRSFLDERNFLEVETPILWSNAGGAIARSFQTNGVHFGGKHDLHMRIAPELFLKQLIIGGMERVYEIGKTFRNEGIDHMHHPEFTMCEFYQTYASYEDTMNMTEELLCTLDNSVFQSSSFPRVDVITSIEAALGITIQDPNDPDTMIDVLRNACMQHDIDISSINMNDEQGGGHTTNLLGKLYDKILSDLIEPTLKAPTFLCHHPICMSPLAQEHPSKHGVTQRFELFVHGKELCNSYTELNSPVEQEERFESIGQLSNICNTEYIHALKYGLPPTVGWGMGIDRLCMLLCNTSNIREVLTFPLLKSSSSSS